MSAHRRISLAFGALYLITFATSLPARVLFAGKTSAAGQEGDNRLGWIEIDPGEELFA